jgi:heat shock protein 90kDa beta
VEDDPTDPAAKDMALMMFRTATLRSGYMLKDTAEFAASVETMMRKTLGVSVDELVSFFI